MPMQNKYPSYGSIATYKLVMSIFLIYSRESIGCTADISYHIIHDKLALIASTYKIIGNVQLLREFHDQLRTFGRVYLSSWI